MSEHAQDIKHSDGGTLEQNRRWATMIAQYWAKRGYDVLPEVTSEDGVKVVRSDMVGGKPRS